LSYGEKRRRKFLKIIATNEVPLFAMMPDLLKEQNALIHAECKLICPYLGCQMVCFQTKNTNSGKFWTVLRWKMLVYFIALWHILRLLVYLTVIWQIFPVLVSCSKYNLATLAQTTCPMFDRKSCRF
jgi:hypothetical protein